MKTLRLFFLTCGLLFLPSVALAAPATATWQHESNVTNEEDGFIIEKRPHATPDAWVQIGTTPRDVFTFVDTLSLGDHMCYRVKAYNAVGSSEPTEEKCVVVMTVPNAPTDLLITITIGTTP